MKALVALAAVLLLAGCKTTQTAVQGTWQEQQRQQRDSAVAARARDYEKQGLSERDARALAQSTYLGYGPR